MIGRFEPNMIPVRSALMKSASEYFPMPVSISGVRLAVKLVPNGPLQAVSVIAPDIPHGGGGGGAGGIGILSGCPESILVISCSGPWAPIFQGVWQSLQLAIVTRYFPRSIGDIEAVDAFVLSPAPGAPECSLLQ